MCNEQCAILPAIAHCSLLIAHLAFCLRPWTVHGQGILCPAVGVLEPFRTCDRRRTFLPLPKGEGRGEGECNTGPSLARSPFSGIDYQGLLFADCASQAWSLF